MNEKTNETRTTDDRDDEQRIAEHPAGALRLLPAVTFGVRAAALVGLAVPIGMVIGSLGAGPGEAVAVTTCCP